MFTNFLGVFLAALSSMLIGFFWYSPTLFGNIWVKLSGFTEKDMEKAKKKGMEKIFAIQFLSSLVMAYVLNFMIRIFLGFGPGNLVSEELNVIHAIIFAAFLWLGFFATIGLNMVLWDGKPLKLYFLHVGNSLVTLIVMTVVLFFVR